MLMLAIAVIFLIIGCGTGNPEWIIASELAVLIAILSGGFTLRR